ncbi:uncharacterized protein AB675_9102 [Cyphellophora attinorum]|uniref:NADH dehydrogenase [ubiquinone] 1 beta subcomplex subunit 2 n=1 Tax=Cyphellophora attinorum TaxID=1664694 RepID=A0A0N0NNM8_9EURO|nr:uncharacterized protein AB675_9102 [Phialophora attinorum]KPI41781.1 hypothetical protein AB675_9102 [Phialophora attinorum]
MAGAAHGKPIWRDTTGKHPVTHIAAARPFYRFAATGLGAAMWFFLFYRMKKDGPALLGWKHPWDH